MHVDDDDRLILADRMNRRFTIFTDMGKGLESKSLAEERTIAPNPILSLDGSFVLKYVGYYQILKEVPASRTTGFFIYMTLN